MTIRNPVEWSADQLRLTFNAARAAGAAFAPPAESLSTPLPRVRRITVSDLGDVLRRGMADFGACRTDIVFICVIYPLAGLVLARIALGYGMWPLLFPLVSGFALIGPFAAAGLYEMSRRREHGLPIAWTDGFKVFASPALAPMLQLGLILTLIFALWLVAAMAIYYATLGPLMPASFQSFARDVFTTQAGWAMIIVGVSVGAIFAVVVLTISVVSFPLLIDRRVSMSTAIRTSVDAVLLNPVPMLAWGLIVAAALALGALPGLVGLIVVVPVLGHATWHLYRKAVR
ncbi:DUF2189 domain-containing protein [Xanthobacter sp. DSM 24535]|uniref:DUF2189 domain-containing protein n=1 Tax=Roseixanthobacter psychrophilus TaxID=3119917 RepID=UPI00372C8EEE